jgi:phospholipid/cholesterol/gamma-HCH transport system ATP-binding protein
MSDDRKIKMRVGGLCKSFANKDVLHDIDFDIPEGQSTVVIGPAASGKSVLMKCLIGLYPVNRGSITVDGQDLTRANNSQKDAVISTFGVLFQQGGLFDSLPVWENVAFKLLNRLQVERTVAREIAVEKLALVDLPPTTADLYPSELSGGMQKRVGLARAMAGDPSFLFLDNPTAGLDPVTSNRINDMVGKTVEQLGATMLCVTSDMEAAHSFYDHLVMLNEGRVVWSGPTRDIDTDDNPYLQQMIHSRADGPIKMRLRSEESVS